MYGRVSNLLIPVTLRSVDLASADTDQHFEPPFSGIGPQPWAKPGWRTLVQTDVRNCATPSHAGPARTLSVCAHLFRFNDKNAAAAIEAAMRPGADPVPKRCVTP
jgi:hypothetical protein